LRAALNWTLSTASASLTVRLVVLGNLSPGCRPGNDATIMVHPAGQRLWPVSDNGGGATPARATEPRCAGSDAHLTEGLECSGRKFTRPFVHREEMKSQMDADMNFSRPHLEPVEGRCAIKLICVHPFLSVLICVPPPSSLRLCAAAVDLPFPFTYLDAPGTELGLRLPARPTVERVKRTPPL
jgi:hypothetical protein